MGKFGDQFRKAREAKKISLDDVSNVTKISSRMLKAIEEENFEQLPGGIFNKGFIRSYAKHLGLNHEEAVNGYLECMQREELEAQKAWMQESSPAKPAAKKNGDTPNEELPGLHLPRAEHVRPPKQKYLDSGERGGLPWPLITVATLVVVLAVILWIRHSHRLPSTPVKAIPQQSQSQPPIVPASAIAPSASGAHPAASTPTPLQSAKLTPASPTPVLPNSSPVKPTILYAAQAAARFPAPDTNTKAAPAPANTPSAALATKPLILVIRAEENSWISVTADGQPVLRETLIAPAHTSVRASREINVRVGNAAGVSFIWNGSELPAQGAESEVKTLVFNAEGLHEVAPAPAAQNQ